MTCKKKTYYFNSKSDVMRRYKNKTLIKGDGNMLVNRKREEEMKPAAVKQPEAQSKADRGKDEINFTFSHYESEIFGKAYRLLQYTSVGKTNEEFMDNRKNLKGLELVDGAKSRFLTRIKVTPKQYKKLEKESEKAKLPLHDYVRAILFTSAKELLEMKREEQETKKTKTQQAHEMRRILPVSIND